MPDLRDGGDGVGGSGHLANSRDSWASSITDVVSIQAIEI